MSSSRSSFAFLASARRAVMAVLVLWSWALPAANVDPATMWTTQSPRGTVDAGLNAACGPSPVLLDAAGNVVLVRIFNHAHGLPFLSIAKFDAEGNLLWRVDDADEPRSHFYTQNWACKAALDPQGNILLASEGQRFTVPWLIGVSFRRLAVAKYSGVDGTRAWQTETDTINARYVGGIATDDQGDVVVMARGESSVPYGSLRTLIAKYQRDTGAPTWTDWPKGEIVTPNSFSSLVIAQGTDVVLAGISRAARLSGATGNTVWLKPMPRVGALEIGADFAGLRVDVSGDLLIAMAEYTTEIEVAPGSYELFRDYVTVKLSGTTGDPVWSSLPQSLSRYVGPAQRDDVATSLALDPSGNVLVHGSSQAGGSDNEHYDFATLKLDGSSGMPIWNDLTAGAARYNGPGQDRDWAAAVGTDPSGDVFVTGSTIDAAGNEDFLTRKISSATGQPLWSGLADFAATHDGSAGSSDAAQGLAVDPGGDVFVVGREATPENDDQVLIRYDGANGAQRWSARSEPTVARDEKMGDYQARTTVVDTAGNTFVAGTTFNGFCSEWLIMKIGPDGTRVWTQRFAPARTAFVRPCGQPFALALDADGDVFVTGQLGSDIGTAKFAGSDGAPLWTGLPDAIAAQDVPYGNYAAYVLAVDSQGDVVVASGIAPFNSVTASFLHTFKYDGESGALVWTGLHGSNPYYIRTGGMLIPRALIVDAQDNVFVTAVSNVDSVMIKYDAATGTALWTNHPDGVAILPCYGPALALDPAQNPVVACSDGDFVTMLYSSADGIPLWTHLPDGEARYNGPANGADSAAAVAVGTNGDIFVSGSSAGADGGTDWAIVRYSGDGTPRWPGVAARLDWPQTNPAPRTLSLSERYVVLSGQASQTSTSLGIGAWSMFDADSGRPLYSETLPEGTSVRSAVVGPDNDIRISGTVDQPSAPAVYVRRVSTSEFPLFGSGFEAVD